ncbi:MAG: hypothetical protein PHF67_03505 [Candidatus Nanoarchaeia archaeon]|nr:hypothetical protein [Candidatus Nanoarchaeia archaeon]
MDAKKTFKILNIILPIFIMVILSVSFVNAYQFLCLQKGEVIRFSQCNPAMHDYYCNSDVYCSYCVYVGSRGYLCPTNMNKCNDQGGSCTSQNAGNSTMDMTPPTLLTCSPANGTISSEKRQYVKCSADESANWFYKDLSKSSGSWKKLCRSTSSCLKKMSFKEGLNNLGIRAVDANGNSAETSVSFTIDSKDPKISKTYPKKSSKSVINGDFSIEFKEDNPKSLVLYYGTKNMAVDLNTCYSKSRTTKICNLHVDVSEFNGQTTSYWFELIDIADTKAVSKPISLRVVSG